MHGRFSAGTLSLAVVNIAACALTEMPSGATDEPTAQITQSLVISHDFVDASGKVTVRIKQCSDSAVGQNVTASCPVDSDFVLVGGGAEVIGNGDPGALLVASYPDTQLMTWNAESKDQHSAFPHALRPYSIGLKLTGVSPATLRASMALVTARSVRSHTPAVAAVVPPDFFVVGGGARANWISQGQLLFQSELFETLTWLAFSKDHLAAEVGTIDVFVIGITKGNIPGFGSLDVTAAEQGTDSSSGYSTASTAVPSGWVLTSIGGKASFQGDGRMLTDMVPFVDTGRSVQGATITSKDHDSHDSGSTSASIIAIRKH